MRRLSVVFVFLLAAALIPFGARAATIEEGFITSFDGTAIHYFLFVPESASASSPVPVILRTHGWGGSGESSVGTGTLSKLLTAGYAVLTWDQRGFGRSGGQAEIDSPDFEGKDVGALIDQLVAGDARFAGSATDPVIGMTGGSYAGGIQFVAAAIDSRIDAIAPEIAWSDLPRSLFPNNVGKLGWDTLLYGVGQTGYPGYLEQESYADGHVGTLNPNIHLSFATTLATNDPSIWYDFYAAHSIENIVGAVDEPTLVLQGGIDTLFPINEGIENFLAVSANGAPTKMIFFNGGHTLGSSVPAGNSRAYMDTAIINWFDKYLKGQAVDTGPQIEWQDQTAAWHSSPAWPAATGSVSFSGTADNLLITAAPTGGGGPAAGNPNQPEGSARIPIAIAGAGGLKIVGIPHINVTLTGTAPDAFLFFKLVDANTGNVLDDQVTPYRASVALYETTFDLDLNGVAYTLPAGHELVLEISTGSLMYANSRVPGLVSASVSGTIPTL